MVKHKLCLSLDFSWEALLPQRVLYLHGAGPSSPRFKPDQFIVHFITARLEVVSAFPNHPRPPSPFPPKLEDNTAVLQRGQKTVLFPNISPQLLIQCPGRRLPLNAGALHRTDKKTQRGCRGRQRAVLWQVRPVEIDGLSPLQKREHSQGPLLNPSRCSGQRWPWLAPSPRTPLLICRIRPLCAAAFHPQRENRRHLASFPNWVFGGAQSTASFVSLLLWCRPSIRPGSSSSSSSSIEPAAGEDLLCALQAPVW